MKQNNIILSIAISFVATTTLLMTSFAEAASVRSLSRETRVQVDGKTFIEVAVNCSVYSKPRIISRASGDNKWCAKNDPSACYRGKIRAARKACSSRKSRATVDKTPDNKAEEVAKAKSEQAVKEPVVKATNKKAPAVNTAKLGPNGKTRSQLMKEYIQIEEQRILVEQQKLELNKRELELQKRELAL